MTYVKVKSTFYILENPRAMFRNKIRIEITVYEIFHSYTINPTQLGVTSTSASFTHSKPFTLHRARISDVIFYNKTGQGVS